MCIDRMVQKYWPFATGNQFSIKMLICCFEYLPPVWEPMASCLFMLLCMHNLMCIFRKETNWLNWHHFSHRAINLWLTGVNCWTTSVIMMADQSMCLLKVTFKIVEYPDKNMMGCFAVCTLSYNNYLYHSVMFCDSAERVDFFLYLLKYCNVRVWYIVFPSVLFPVVCGGVIFGSLEIIKLRIKYWIYLVFLYCSVSVLERTYAENGQLRRNFIYTTCCKLVKLCISLVVRYKEMMC